MRYAVNTDHVASRTLDEGTVLIHFDTGYYYSLNHTGTLVWTLLSQRAMTLEELVAALSHEFSLPREQVTPDVRKHLEHLAAEDLLVTR